MSILHSASYELMRDPEALLPLQVSAPSGLPDARLSEAFRHLDTQVSARSLPKYRSGALWLFSRLQDSSVVNPRMAGPFDIPERVSVMWHDVLKASGATMRFHKSLGCYYLVVPPDLYDRFGAGLNGTYMVYEVLIARGLYAGRNPLEAPGADRRAGRAARSLFRIDRRSPRPPRTEMPAVVERIRQAGRAGPRPWPPSVRLLVDLMIEGLARLSEQIMLTVRDWWEGSRFGTAILTPNKGDDFARTKTQIFSDRLAGMIRVFFDGERMDRHGRKLADYRALAEAGRLAELEVPLFPNGKGGFFSQSGVADYYLRRAFDAAGLFGVSSHAIRHAGVNTFLRWLAELDAPFEEKVELKRRFGEYMGWKRPEEMLDYYSLPERQRQAIEVAARFLQSREGDLRARANAALPAANDDGVPVVAAVDDELERMFRRRRIA